MTAAQAKGEALDLLLDLYTDECAQALQATVVAKVSRPPQPMSHEDAATCMVGALLQTLVQVCGAAMPPLEGETLHEHAARLVGFITDGLADAAPIFLGADPDQGAGS